MREITLMLTFTFLFINIQLYCASAQNVGIGTNLPNPSAQLDVSSTSRGFLPPRMSFAQRNEITNPVAGLMIFCTDCDSSGQPQYYNGSRWCNMLGGIAASTINTAGNIPSVTIGTQIWSTKNLDVATDRNGDPIPQVTDPTQWIYSTTGAWCWYNNDSSTYAATYGRMYNWYAVNDPRGLAPQGWHVPTNREWDIMTNFLDPTVDTTVPGWTGTDVGTKLKNTSGWLGSGNGSNSSGFSGLPGGDRTTFDGQFGIDGYWVAWWSASSSDASEAWTRYLQYNKANVSRFIIMKNSGNYVRIVKD